MPFADRSGRGVQPQRAPRVAQPAPLPHRVRRGGRRQRRWLRPALQPCFIGGKDPGHGCLLQHDLADQHGPRASVRPPPGQVTCMGRIPAQDCCRPPVHHDKADCRTARAGEPGAATPSALPASLQLRGVTTLHTHRMDHNPSWGAGVSGRRPVAVGPDQRPDQEVLFAPEEVLPIGGSTGVTVGPAVPGPAAALDLDAVSDYVPALDDGLALDYGPIPDNEAARDYGKALDYTGPPGSGRASESASASAPAQDPAPAVSPHPTPDPAPALHLAPEPRPAPVAYLAPAQAPDPVPGPGPAAATAVPAQDPGPAEDPGPAAPAPAQPPQAPAQPPQATSRPLRATSSPPQAPAQPPRPRPGHSGPRLRRPRPRPGHSGPRPARGSLGARPGGGPGLARRLLAAPAGCPGHRHRRADGSGLGGQRGVPGGGPGHWPRRKAVRRARRCAPGRRSRAQGRQPVRAARRKPQRPGRPRGSEERPPVAAGARGRPGPDGQRHGRASRRWPAVRRLRRADHGRSPAAEGFRGTPGTAPAGGPRAGTPGHGARPGPARPGLRPRRCGALAGFAPVLVPARQVAPVRRGRRFHRDPAVPLQHGEQVRHRGGGLRPHPDLGIGGLRARLRLAGRSC